MGKQEKVRSIEKLAAIGRPCLGICAGKHCAKAGTKHILRAVQAALHECDMADIAVVELTKCQDYCDDAPTMTVLPGPYPYVELTPEAARVVVKEHLRSGKPVVPLLHKRTRKRLKK